MARVLALLFVLACRDPQTFVYYAPTPPEVVDVMMQLGAVTPADVVYDLGCGDGRIVIAAVKRGARGVCIDIDALRIVEAKKNAIAAGVVDRIRFATQDAFTTDVSDATVVMLYLSQAINVGLRPRLQRMLRPGARIVSHWHDMGDWPPAKTVRVRAEDQGDAPRGDAGGVPPRQWVRPVYLWRIE